MRGWAILLGVVLVACGTESDPFGGTQAGVGGGEAGSGAVGGDESGGGGSGGIAGAGGAPQGGGGSGGVGGSTLCPAPECPTEPNSWNCDPACGATAPECSAPTCAAAPLITIPSGVSQLRLPPITEATAECTALPFPQCDPVWWGWRVELPHGSPFCLHVRGPESARYYHASTATMGAGQFTCFGDDIACVSFSVTAPSELQNYHYLEIQLLDPAVALASAPADGGALFTFELAAGGCSDECGTDCGGGF